MTPKLLDDLSQETKKGLHKLRVINYLLRNKTATMTDIAKELYVSVPTASKILQDLQDGGCIQSQGKLEIGVGRFPLLFGLNPDGGLLHRRRHQALGHAHRPDQPAERADMR